MSVGYQGIVCQGSGLNIGDTAPFTVDVPSSTPLGTVTLYLQLCCYAPHVAGAALDLNIVVDPEPNPSACYWDQGPLTWTVRGGTTQSSVEGVWDGQLFCTETIGLIPAGSTAQIVQNGGDPVADGSVCFVVRQFVGADVTLNTTELAEATANNLGEWDSGYTVDGLDYGLFVTFGPTEKVTPALSASAVHCVNLDGDHGPPPTGFISAGAGTTDPQDSSEIDVGIDQVWTELDVDGFGKRKVGFSVLLLLAPDSFPNWTYPPGQYNVCPPLTGNWSTNSQNYISVSPFGWPGAARLDGLPSRAGRACRDIPFPVHLDAIYDQRSRLETGTPPDSSTVHLTGWWPAELDSS